MVAGVANELVGKTNKHEGASQVTAEAVKTGGPMNIVAIPSSPPLKMLTTLMCCRL